MNADPFFIVGSDRSGTTMLRLMLNEHSRLHIPPESWFIIDLLNQLPCDEPLLDDDLRRAVTLISRHRRWPDWGIPEARLRRTILSLGQPSLSELVSAVFGLSNPGKARWGDKTPDHVFEIERLHRLFPTAKFIHIIRDGRDVCLSLNRVAWRGSETAQIARYWRDSVAAGRRQGTRLPGGAYMEVAYEDLVIHTEDTLRTVCAFLGEAFEVVMLGFYRHAVSHIPPWERGFHTRIARPPQRSDTQRWERELSELKVATFEALAGPVMDMVGQSRRYSGFRRVFPLAMGAAFWLADLSLPIRRRLGIHFPELRKRL